MGKIITTQFYVYLYKCFDIANIMKPSQTFDDDIWDQTVNYFQFKIHSAIHKKY